MPQSPRANLRDSKSFKVAVFSATLVPKMQKVQISLDWISRHWEWKKYGQEGRQEKQEMIGRKERIHSGSLASVPRQENATKSTPAPKQELMFYFTLSPLRFIEFLLGAV